MGHVADRRTATVKERWLFSYVVNGRRLLFPSALVPMSPPIPAGEST
jgi:hypothetical protein